MGLNGGIERGWYTGEGTGNARRKGQQGTLDLTTQVIMNYVNSQDEDDGVVDDDDEE